MIDVRQLDSRVCYCVLRDDSNRESILMHGVAIKRAAAHRNPDVQRLREDQGIWASYVRVRCGDFWIGIWRDPTRPELNEAEYDNVPVPLHTVPAPTVDSEAPVETSTNTPTVLDLIHKLAVATSRTLFINA